METLKKIHCGGSGGEECCKILQGSFLFLLTFLIIKGLCNKPEEAIALNSCAEVVPEINFDREVDQIVQQCDNMCLYIDSPLSQFLYSYITAGSRVDLHLSDILGAAAFQHQKYQCGPNTTPSGGKFLLKREEMSNLQDVSTPRQYLLKQQSSLADIFNIAVFSLVQ